MDSSPETSQFMTHDILNIKLAAEMISDYMTHSTASTEEERPTFPIFKSWAEIIAYYRRFLSGELDQCPTHGGPLEDESKVIGEQLLEVNRLGVLTVDSQPGFIEREGKAKFHWRGRVRHMTKYESRQRAALLCFMYKPQLQKLKKAFAKKDHLIFAQRAKLIGTMEAPKMTIPITAISFVYRGKERHEVDSEQPTDGWLSSDMEIILNGSSTADAKKIMKDLYQVHLLDPVWGRSTQLFDDLIAALS